MKLRFKSNEAVATYQVEAQAKPIGEKCAGIDLGEIHMAVSHDGEQTHILNGRYLRAKRSDLKLCFKPTATS